MNRIAGRSIITIALALALVVGMVFFGGEYLLNAEDWVMFPGSPHVYSGNNIGCGVITDRNGELLLDITGERLYSDSASLRKTTIHWLGDRDGYISAPALSAYSADLAGFSLVNGVYSYSGGGGTAILALSADVQRAAQKAMGGNKGVIAVYNYKTGELICALTTPNYDPDDVPDIEGDATGKYEGAYLNRFVQSKYVPGSIFKLVTTAAALENLPDIENQHFTCTGSYEIGGEAVTCERVHGKLDFKGALAHSCNCSYAQIVEQLGRETMERYVEQFRVTQPVEFDGITTVSGNYETSDSMLETAWSGIGQFRDQVNPCRYLTFMGAIAAGGDGVEPHLVQRVEAGGRTVYQAKASSTGRIMTSYTAQVLQEYMRNNVETVYGANHFPGLTVCAKSGTGQIGGGQKANAMFAGFVADPEYPLAFIVCVENGGYGSNTCVPILAPVLQACKEMMDKG